MSTATKDELIEEAESRGLEVPSGATKADIEQLLADNPAPGEEGGEPSESETEPGQVQQVSGSGSMQGVGPGIVVPDDTNRRSDKDVIQGRFARVTAGEHEGRYGVVMYLGGEPDADGFPTTAVLLTRDDLAEDLTVGYDELEPAVSGHR